MQVRLNAAMETFAQRVKARRDALKLNQSQVAKLAGLKQPDISKIELGGIQKTTEILGLARALQCNPDWLVTGEGEMQSGANITLPAFQMSGSGGPTAIELENNPLYPAIRRVKLKAQAGVSGYAVEYSTEDDGPPIVFRADWYKAKGYRPEKMLALRVTGESMIPSMYEGDLIVINTLSTTPKQGIPFLVSYEGEVCVKRLVRDDELWWLTSDNPDQRRYPRTKCNGGTEIIGEVVYRQTERV